MSLEERSVFILAGSDSVQPFRFYVQRHRHCEESINDQSHKTRIHPQEGIAAGEDEESHNGYPDYKTGVHSRLGHPLPEKTANDTREELTYTVITQDKEIHQFIGE
jgi:hypothetical protein